MEANSSAHGSSLTKFDIVNIERRMFASLRADVDNIIQDFCALKTTQFDAFAKLFNDMEFSTIFLGRLSIAELVEFSENLLLYAARFMLPESNAEISNQANGSQPRHIKSEFDIPERDDKSLHEHIGGIYITYCLYFLQPAQYVMPIRMSTTQMESLHKYLAEVLLPEEQYEAMFCIFRLVRGNAFAVTPFETEYNPILYRRFDPAGSDPNMIEKDLQNIESGDDFTFLKELNSDTLISQIDSVHNAYMKAKAQRGLLDTNNKKLGLNLVKGNLCNFVANLLNETKKALEEQRQLKVRLPTTNSSQESDTNRRSKIRSDAYSQGLVHQRHRRHRMGHVDRNSESQDLVSPVKQEIRPSTSENPTTSSSPAKRRKSATSPEKRPKTRRPAAASSKSPTSKVRTGHTEVEADESDDAMKKKLNKLQAELLRMSSD